MTEKQGYRIVVSENDKGGPEKMKIEHFEVKEPKDNEVLIEVKACGVNFVDTYHRTGLYPGVTQLGREGSGVIIAIGKNVQDFQVNDKVCWAGLSGSYTTHLTTDQIPSLMKIPKNIVKNDDSNENKDNELNLFKIAASIPLQGLTAHYLIQSVYKVTKDDTVLIHAGAGGTGGLLIQICRNVCQSKCIITTVSSDEKAALAKSYGAHHCINYTKENFYEKVMEITDKKGVNVVYDGVGKDTANDSLRCVKPRGTLVFFGNSSGSVPPIDPLLLTKQGSIYLTRPSLANFIGKDELPQRIHDIFSWVCENKMKINIGEEFSLKDVAKSHEHLEGRQHVGKIILLP